MKKKQRDSFAVVLLYASYADTVGCCSRNSDSTGSRTADC